MKILIAPNAYKESLSAPAVAQAISQGIRQAHPQAKIIYLPIADGGDGTLDILINLTSGRIFQHTITAPFGTKQIKARWGLLDTAIQHRRLTHKTALLETAEAAGLKRVPLSKRKPLNTHTYGVGELIKYVLTRDARQIIIGLGGSATVDGGTGLARALGIRFLNKFGKSIPLGGAALKELTHIDLSNLDPRIKHTRIIGACDVIIPLIGPQGAARVFGPQKGARPQDIALLEDNLEHLARIIQHDIGINIKNIAGGGAAGGLGAGLCAFLQAQLLSGTEFFLQLIDYRAKLKGIDLVITGEGRLDQSSLLGKGPIILAQTTKKIAPIPVIAICGSISDQLSDSQIRAAGIDAWISLTNNRIRPTQAMKHAASLITQKTAALFKNLSRLETHPPLFG